MLVRRLRVLVTRAELKWKRWPLRPQAVTSFGSLEELSQTLRASCHMRLCGGLRPYRRAPEGEAAAAGRGASAKSPTKRPSSAPPRVGEPARGARGGESARLSRTLVRCDREGHGVYVLMWIVDSLDRCVGGVATWPPVAHDAGPTPVPFD